MVGCVITKSLDDVESGSIGVVMTSVGQIKGICTVEHITSQGEFYVTGEYEGELSSQIQLYKLMVKQDYKVYPLKFNQWKKSIKAGEVNTNKEVNFELKPLKFVKGNYRRECYECGTDFLAHKKQPYCKDCCNRNAVARIVINKPKLKSANKINTRRNKMLNSSTAKLIATEAYKHGIAGKSFKFFESWLKKQF